MKRTPSWACEHYVEHDDGECPECLSNFRSQGSNLATSDRFPPRVRFQRGWLTLSATHWFEAVDSSVFVARDGQRTLAQAICGQICDVTLTYAPVTDWRRCTKCLRALGMTEVASLPIQPGDPNSHEFAEESASKSSTVVRLYRGLKEPYDPNRPSRDPRSGADFTDCPLTALSYATGSRGVVLVIDVDATNKYVYEALWASPKVKRCMVREYQDFVVTVIPAKELRAQIRRKGVASTTDDYKAEVLRAYIERYLTGG